VTIFITVAGFLFESFFKKEGSFKGCKEVTFSNLSAGKRDCTLSLKGQLRQAYVFTLSFILSASMTKLTISSSLK
jgi:hypothetical protein